LHDGKGDLSADERLGHRRVGEDEGEPLGLQPIVGRVDQARDIDRQDQGHLAGLGRAGCQEGKDQRGSMS
jgi:hypothetical protein